MPAPGIPGASDARRGGDPAPRRVPSLALALGLAALGVILSFLTWWWLIERAQQREEAWLAAHGEVVAETVAVSMAAVVDRLVAVGGLYEASEEVTRAEFERFVGKIGIPPGVYWIAHAPIVAAGELSRFELETSQTVAGYGVHQLDQSLNRGPVTERPRHLPVQWLEPAAEFGELQGLDLASESSLMSAIEQAEIRSDLAASTFLPLLPAGEGQGVALIWPVFEPGPEDVVGVVVAMVDPREVVDAHLPPALAAAVDWTVSESPLEPDRSDRSWRGTEELGGRPWHLTVSPTSGSGMDGAGSTLVLLAGVVASLLGGYGLYQYRRWSDSKAEVVRLRELAGAKDRFLASVSHELRTPLTGVVGFAELLWDEGETLSEEEKRGIIRNIAWEAGDLAAIIEDLLVAARSELDLVTVTRVPIESRALIVKMLETSHESQDGIRVAEGSADDWRVLGDPARLRQILRNLVSNARHYGGSQIELRSASETDQVHIQVADDGDGLPPEEWEKIFEPYYRFHHVESQPAALGIGLSISRHLARLMGGDLTYRHEEGWSIFELSLPAADVSELRSVAAGSRNQS